MNQQELSFILKMRDEATAVLKRLGGAFNDAGNEARGAADDTKQLGTSLDDLKQTATDVAAAIGGIWASTAGIRAATDQWAKYELGLIGVQKTTNMSAAEMATFRAEFDRLNSTMNGIETAELAAMAEAAGQMGVTGTPNLIAFTDVMGKLGVTTDIAGAEGAQAVGRLIELTGELSPESLADFGDTLNFLGNTSKATEREILSMATTLATSTAGMGLATDAVLALSAAAAESGLRDELTGSVFGRTLLTLKEGSANATAGFKQFLEVTNMTKEQFDELAATNPEQVILRFAEAYAKLAPTGQGTNLLKSLGIDGIEVKRVLGTVGNNIDNFQAKLAAIQSGQQEGALDREAANFFGADANQIQALGKAWERVKEVIGEALAPLTGAIVEGATQAFYALANVISSIPGPIKTIVVSSAMLAPGIFGAVKAVALLRTGFLALKGAGLLPFAGTITTIGTKLREAATAMMGFKSALTGTSTSIGLFTRLQANIGAIVALIPKMGGFTGILTTIGRSVLQLIARLGNFGGIWGKVAALAATALLAIWDNWDSIREFLTKSPKEIVEAIGNWFGQLPDRAMKGLKALWESVKTFFSDMLKRVKEIWDAGVKFVFETLPNINWSNLFTEVWNGIVGAIENALNEAGRRLKEWWESPLWAKEQVVTVKPQVQAPNQRPRAQGEATSDINTNVTLNPSPTGGGGSSGPTIADVTRDLRDQIADVRALTGAAKDRLETERIIRDAVESTGVSYATARKQLGGLIAELQRARADAAISELVLGYDDQIADARAITGEQRLQLDIMREINDLEREFGNITEANREAIRAKAQELFEVRQETEFQQQLRDADLQLAALQATTEEQRNYLDVVQQIVEFEREYGRLTEANREALATRLIQVRQITEFQRLADQYDPVGSARRRYEEEARTLEVMRQQKVITEEYYQLLRSNLDEQSLSARNPLGERARVLQEEINILRQLPQAQQREADILREVNSLRQQGVVITDELVEAVREYHTALEEFDLQSNLGIGGFINSVGTLREGLLGLTQDFASGLSGAIAGALKGDGNAFRAFAQQLGGKMIDWGVNQLTAQMFKALGGLNPQEKALDRAQAAIQKIEALGSTLQTPQAIVNAGTVSINGQMLSDALGAAAASNGVAQTAMSNGIVNVSAVDQAVGQRAASAVDAAAQLLGANERTNRSQVNSFLRQGGVNIDAATTAWCAGFVNSALKQIGVDGTGKLTASSFLSWGVKVDPSQVMKGDVLIDHNGRREGQTGAHVGFATGNTRMLEGRRQIEMLSGNESNRVQTSWYNESDLAIRRATEAMGNAPMAGAEQAGQQLTQVTQQVHMASQQLTQAVQPVATNLQQAGMAFQQNGMQAQVGTQQATMAMQQMNMAQQQTGQAATATGQQFQQAGAAIQQAGQAAAAGAQAAQMGGAGGGAGGLGAMMGGGGAMAGIGALAPMLGSGLGSAISGKRAGGTSQMLSMFAQFLPPPWNLLVGGGLGFLGGLFGFAEGGKIKGPGTGTSDSILAAVSDGEFVVNAKATKEWEPVLRAINDNKVPKFRKGGLVGGPAVGMGERALVSGRAPALADTAALAEQVDALTRTVGKAMGNGRGRINNNSVNVTVNARDADSFRRSEGQLMADAQMKIGRFGSRNN